MKNSLKDFGIRDSTSLTFRLLHPLVLIQVLPQLARFVDEVEDRLVLIGAVRPRLELLVRHLTATNAVTLNMAYSED